MSKVYKRPSPCRASAESIYSFAETIAKALNLRAGSDLEPHVIRLGGSITYLPFAERDSRWASITVEAFGIFTIQLPTITFPLQKRISIAHELGHLFLHANYGRVALKAYHDAKGENELVEYEANEFARAFLMPAKSVRRIAKIFNYDSIGVAAHFMVPEPVARQRMQDVGFQ